MAYDQNALSAIEEDAHALTQAALALSRAIESNDRDTLAAALDTNLKLWIGIRTLVSRDDNPLPKDVRDNLVQLSHFVTKTTFAARDGGAKNDLEAMINTNLQISEGLLEGRARATTN
ncbi:flagellar biosynthesis regulator FlaF [Roseospira visakhapatnamensis]|uniref:Flagellar biosynthesis regulator FlaF n=1 Tax=Roseospira visakhapatnamensis TaxID=390880 RepID=A0A7W6RC45_9PROT|nr:flagellar biosynthesis regulator FlaF [Roseospira visakhapatnamensis]MBB4265647.1 flagellar biosynthesis regulator FlaF [Roseospira visakhapatnamensis]